MDVTYGMDNKYKELTEMEQKIYDNCGSTNYFREFVIDIIKSARRSQSDEVARSQQVRDIIKTYKKRHCPECGEYLRQDFDDNPFLDNWSCENKHTFGPHELPVVYLWKIYDLYKGDEMEKR